MSYDLASYKQSPEALLDDDGDGLVNLLELVTGGDHQESLTQTEHGPLHIQSVQSNGELLFHAQRLKDLEAVGLALDFEYSHDLFSWHLLTSAGAPIHDLSVRSERSNHNGAGGFVEELDLSVSIGSEPLYLRSKVRSLPDLSGKTIYVDSEHGNDDWSGLLEEAQSGDGPVASFAKAVERLEPGDTLSILANSEPYHEPLMLEIAGTAEAPITIEGNGAIIDLLQNASNGPWRKENGLWVLENVVWDTSIISQKQRAFAFYQGIPIALPRATVPEGELPPLYTAIADAEGYLHIRLPDELTPPFKDLYIVPQKDECVSLTNAQHLLIRNLHVRGAGNDGFNFRGDCRNLMLENCSAILCGDEGASAHGTAEAEFRNSLFAWTGSYGGGANDVHDSRTTYLSCISAFNRGTGFDLTGAAHTLENSYSVANSFAQNNSNLPSETVSVTNLTELDDSATLVSELETLAQSNAEMAQLVALGKALNLYPFNMAESEASLETLPLGEVRLRASTQDSYDLFIIAGQSNTMTGRWVDEALDRVINPKAWVILGNTNQAPEADGVAVAAVEPFTYRS